MTSNDPSLKNSVVIIPLHLPLGYPCDYIDQTAKILSSKNKVVYFDFYRPYSWKKLLEPRNLKKVFESIADIYARKRAVYFRSPALLPFSRSKTIARLNQGLGFYLLSFLLLFTKKRVIVWQFSTLILNKFLNQLFVYDCVDYKNSLDNDEKYFHEEKRLFRISDVVSFNSEGLYKNKLKGNQIEKKSIINVCGCDYDLFQKKYRVIPGEYKNIGLNRIILMGLLDERVDTSLLEFTVKQNRDLSFIFIGHIKETVVGAFDKLLKQRNVFYLGEKNKADLPKYLVATNVGIIPYNSSDNLVKFANPMKAYEYLASGLPVVSTNILALKNLPKNIVYTTDDKKEFSRALKTMVNDWNSVRILKAKAVAKKNSWENKVKNVVAHIQNEK